MTIGRRPSTPPAIAGYEVGRLLGMGGFADVFLYEQQLPRRPVAVKVLLAESLDEVLTRFGTEADLMAQLSHHPSIVTIHQAAVAADGRPYLVMEYCSRPGLGARYRSERISVAEALRIGIRLASAVETAHRAGILHRDIKPANVLITDFGWPALTDFGIAATTGWGRGSAVGMSIPWSPPELLAEHPTGDVRADVYSLGATVYALLAGRSPFEIPGGANGPADLIARIERAPLPATGRTDVPATLQAALARAMEKNPVRRFHSALALARALQAVEHELMLPGTPVELPDDAARPEDAARPDDAALPAITDEPHPVDDAATRLRPVVTIDPEGADGAPPAPPRWPAGRSPVDEAAEATRVRPVRTIRPEGSVPGGTVPADGTGPAASAGDASRSAAPVGEERRSGAPDDHRAAASTGGPTTGRGSLPLSAVAPAAAAPGPREPALSRTPSGPVPTRPSHGSVDAVDAPEPRTRPGGTRPRVLATVAAAVVVAGALAGAAALAEADRAPATGTSAGTSTGDPAAAGPAVVAAVPSPQGVAGARQADGSVVFSWTNPQPQDGDRYLWGLTRAGEQVELETVDEATVRVPPGAEPPVCLEVSIVREDRRASTRPVVGCAP